jgi:hypothetical protein
MNASKAVIAGKASGIKRAKIVKVRRYFVLAAYEQLKPKYQAHPYSLEALDALEEEFCNPTRDEYVYSITNAHELKSRGRRIGAARRLPSERLEAMLDEVLPILLEGELKSGRLRDVSRETLIDDLQALGIKSKIRQKKSI